MCVRTLLPGAFVEAAEFAIGDTDVGVVEMPIDVVIGRQAVLSPPDRVSQLPDGVKVGGAIKRDAFVKCEAFAKFYLFGDKVELRVSRGGSSRGCSWAAACRAALRSSRSSRRRRAAASPS